MKRQNNFLKTVLLLLALVAGVNAAWATDIPLSVGSYLTTSESATTGTINNNDNGNLGGIKKTDTPTTATFSSLTVSESQNLVLTFLTGNNNNSSPKVTVTLNNGTSDIFTTGEVDIENSGTGNWTPVTMHTFDMGNIPAGTYSLKFTFDNSNTSDYVCNLGSIGLYNKTDYLATLDAMPGDITLNKGTYKTAKLENAGNVGYMSNGATAYYPSLYVSNAGKATLNIGLVHYGDGTLNVKITDLSTGEEEINKNLAITSAVCKGLETTTAFELGNITAGYKSMKFTVSTEASYLANYKALSLALESFNNIAIDLRNGQLGTSGSNLQKYLTIDGETYNYADDEPANYNALLSASSFNGNEHGYVNFKAKVPVKAGIYKITLGTCAWGSNAYVKNADESSTLNVVDVNGQTVTSVNQNNGTCYHNNTTSNVVSMWYNATNDETITVVCGNYTPFFSIEKVNAVPELKYSVTYANNTAGVEGNVPDVAYATAGNSVTLPVNRTLYKEGYTLTGWNDGNTTYEPGENYTPTANVTLNAVFTQNTYTFDQTVSEMTVRWDFQRQNGCPTISMQGAGATDILVQQANVNGNTIDMKMEIDATNGKFANGGWTDWAQVNDVTTFSFPSIEGTTVKAYSMNEPKNDSDVKSSVDGNEYSAYASNIATYATTPTNSSSTMTVKGGGYYRYIDVTYPAAAIAGITELTVDGVAVGSEIIAAINNGDAYTATLSGNIYTAVPAVQATFDTSAQASGVASGTGTSRTYTITQADKTYTLIVEGIHVYTAGQTDESVNIKYNAGTVENNVWTNGVYTMTTSGIGNGGEEFKFDANTDEPYTIAVPADVVVKQFIIKNFHANYSGGDGQLKTVTSTGATTYIPTKRTCVYSGETTAANRTYEGPSYDLIVNLENHTAGTPIVFTMKKSAQPMGWIQLTTVKQAPTTPPTKTAESVTIEKNHAVVAVTFDREIANNVEATINNTTVTAEGGTSTLYFPVWDLSYDTNYTLTIAAGAASDTYNNVTSTAIEIAVNVPAKAAVSAAVYDHVVSTAAEFSEAVTAVNSSNNSASAARKTIFIKNGDYDFGSTEQHITGYNVSLIGESRDGVILHGSRTGISNPVLNIRDRSGFYLQDLTVKNDYDYGTGSFYGVAVAIYGGDKTIMKNVRMLSNQDTQVTGHRAYMDNCEIHGTVDFICGGGDNYYYQTELVLEDRGGNVIAAPSTNSSHKWGYVFQECTIKAIDATAATTNEGSYYLGRPWQNEPRAYFLNTTMNVLPNAAGWTNMSSSLPTHFYEYGSLNGSNEVIDLSSRTAPSSSTNLPYTPVMTSEQAAKYTLKNVLGGTDSWLPTDYTNVVDAPTISLDGSTLSWTAVDDARCYVIFKNGEYYANQTGTSYSLTEEGLYTVRAANEMGGLGTAASDVVFKRSITAGNWSTIVLPFDIPSSDITTIFGAEASVAELSSSTENTLNFSTTLTDSKMKANQPYAIKVASDFTSATINGVTIVEDTPTQTITNWQFVGTYNNGTIAAENNYYFKSNKLYKAGGSGTTSIKPFRAYLHYTGSDPAPAPTFTIDGNVTGIAHINADGQMNLEEGAVYNLAGQRVANPTKGLYIVNGKKVIVK